MRVSIVVGLAAVLAATASAQPTLTMGSSNFGAPYGSDTFLGAVRTAVDLAAPANASGELDRVRFHRSATGCAAAAMVNVFRRVGDSFTLVAERGFFRPGRCRPLPVQPRGTVAGGGSRRESRGVPRTRLRGSFRP